MEEEKKKRRQERRMRALAMYKSNPAPAPAPASWGYGKEQSGGEWSDERELDDGYGRIIIMLDEVSGHNSRTGKERSGPPSSVCG